MAYLDFFEEFLIDFIRLHFTDADAKLRNLANQFFAVNKIDLLLAGIACFFSCCLRKCTCGNQNSLLYVGC